MTTRAKQLWAQVLKGIWDDVSEVCRAWPDLTVEEVSALRTAEYLELGPGGKW